MVTVGGGGADAGQALSKPNATSFWTPEAPWRPLIRRSPPKRVI